MHSPLGSNLSRFFRAPPEVADHYAPLAKGSRVPLIRFETSVGPNILEGNDADDSSFNVGSRLKSEGGVLTGLPLD